MIATILLATSLTYADDSSFSFVVVGDTQTDGTHTSINWDVVPDLVDSMNRLSPDFAIFVGDLVGGSYSLAEVQNQWSDFDVVTSALTCERYMVPGNHDMYSGNNVFDAWVEMWPFLPTQNSPPGEEGMTYYFDYGNTRFISVLTDDPIDGYVPMTQPEWLEDVLADSGEFEHVFVYSHHPVSFSTESPTGGVLGEFWQSLIAHDVVGYFSGHWHRYQPSQLGGGGDTWETIIGTGGGALFPPWRAYQQVQGFLYVEVDGPLVTATFYGDEDLDGNYGDPLDSYVMAWDGEPPTGMVAHYDFEDGRVLDLGDEDLTKRVHGELHGDARLVTDGGIVGDGVEFQGNGYVEAGAIGDYNLAFKTDMTLSTFARVDSVPSGSWGGALLTYGTADYYTEDEETNYSYWLSILSDGTLLAFWEYGNGTNVSLSSTVAAPMDGNWHQYAMTRNADDMEVVFFLDGTPLGEPVEFEDLPTGGGRGMLYMGSDVTGITGYELDGAMDEVCLFNRVLSEEDLSEIYLDANCVLSEANPDDSGDTGSSDSGAPMDSGVMDTGDTNHQADSHQSELDGLSNSELAACGCATGHRRLIGAWLLMMLGIVAIRRRQSVVHP